METILSAYLAAFTAFIYSAYLFSMSELEFSLLSHFALTFRGILLYPSFQTCSDDPNHLRQP